MTLGSEQGVTDICGSTDADLISRQLVVARARLDIMLAPYGLTAPDPDVMLSHAVDLIASSLIAAKPGAVDPTTNFEVDGFKRSDKSTAQAEGYAQQAVDLIADYVAANDGDAAATSVPLPRSTTS